MSLRIGINLQNKARSGQDRSAAEKSYLPEFLQQLNASAIVCMDDLPFAEAMHQRLHNTIVIYRQFNEAEGHLWRVISPEQYFINQKGISKPGILLYVINEPNSKADVAELNDRVKWLIRVMELYAANGLSLVVDNLGPGQPDLTNFTDDAKWAVIRPLFDAFKRYPMMFWGLHPYWSDKGLRPQDGQSARHRDIEKALKARGYDMPNVIFTEVGRDAYGGSKTNGWRSSGISEESYAAEILEARNTLWTEPYIRGACVFCYGSVTPRWAAFDIESAKVLHRVLIAGNEAVSIPPPPPAPPSVPLPGDLGAAEVINLQGAVRFALQATPTIDPKQTVGNLANGDQVKIYRRSETIADALVFYWVVRTNTPPNESAFGWVAYHMLPPIIDVPTETTAERDVRQIAINRAQQKLLRDEDARLEAEIAAITAKYMPTEHVAA